MFVKWHPDRGEKPRNEIEKSEFTEIFTLIGEAQKILKEHFGVK